MHAMSRFLSFGKIKIIKIGVCVKSCIHSQNVFDLLSNTLQIYTFFYNLQNFTTKYLDYLVNQD